MKTWSTSLNGAISLSMAAFVAMLGRSIGDARYVLTEDFGSSGPSMVGLWIVAYSAFFAGWLGGSSNLWPARSRRVAAGFKVSAMPLRSSADRAASPPVRSQTTLYTNSIIPPSAP